MMDSVGNELNIGDKIIHFGLIKTRTRAAKGTITRFTKKSLIYRRLGDEHYDGDLGKWLDIRVTHTGSVIKYDWKK